MTIIFGFRPLLDRVEVWVIDKVHSSIVFPSLTKPKRGTMTEGVELDPGCTYLLLNRKSGLARDENWAVYFLNKLNSLNLFGHVSQTQVTELGILPAHGIKPGCITNRIVIRISHRQSQVLLKLRTIHSIRCFRLLHKVSKKFSKEMEFR